MKSDLAFFEKKKLTVMKSNDGKYEFKRFKSSCSHVGGSPILSYLPYRDFRSNLKTQLIYGVQGAGISWENTENTFSDRVHDWDSKKNTPAGSFQSKWGHLPCCGPIPDLSSEIAKARIASHKSWMFYRSDHSALLIEQAKVEKVGPT